MAGGSTRAQRGQPRSSVSRTVATSAWLRGYGALDDLHLRTVQHELGPPEHAERPVRVDVAPREVQEALPALAMDGGTTEVELPVLVDDGRDVHLPASLRRIAGHETHRFLANLDADAHVWQWRAVGLAEGAAR